MNWMETDQGMAGSVNKVILIGDPEMRLIPATFYAFNDRTESHAPTVLKSLAPERASKNAWDLGNQIFYRDRPP